MLLDRIDIDAHGPLNCVELGPFSEHLNVVCGPEGSGKTAIVRFLRDSLVHRDYPLGMMSSSTGRVVWADRYGMVHCRREKDGTAQGRRTIEVESRGNNYHNEALHESLRSPWLHTSPGSHSQALAAKSVQLPESIVDGVITDTSVTSVGRVVSACIRSGLDSPDTFRGLTLEETIPTSEVAASSELRRELADVEAELARADRDGIQLRNYDHLIRRREELTSRLQHSGGRAVDWSNNQYWHGYRGEADWQKQLTTLHDRANQLRHRRTELGRWMEAIDRDIANYASTVRQDVGPTGSRSWDGTSTSHHAAEIDDQLRRRLDDLDGQMIRWRRALVEIRGLREAIVASRDALSHAPTDYSGYEQARLQDFLRSVDHYGDEAYRQANLGDASGWYRSADASSRPYHQIDEIHSRVDSAIRHMDSLLHQAASDASGTFAWFDTYRPSEMYRSQSSLRDSLRAIRDDLGRLGQQVPAYGAHAAVRDVVTRDWRRLEELQHSERWLSEAIKGLSRHREDLLRTHLTSQDDTLAWRNDRTHRDLAAMRRERDQRAIELKQTTEDLDRILAEAANLRRSMRYLPIIDGGTVYHGADTRWTNDHEVRAELHRVEEALASLSHVDRLRIRRDQLRAQLSRPARRPSNSPLSDLASRWLARLSGGRLTRVTWPYQLSRDLQPTHTYHRPPQAFSGIQITAKAGVDGQEVSRDETHCSGADRALASLAVRMAAGELLGQLGRHVPLVVETHRELTSAIRSTPTYTHDGYAYQQHGDLGIYNHTLATALRDYAREGRQIVMLTSDQNLAEQMGRAGARQYVVQASRQQHAHRPLYRPHYRSENYVGPHPHTYGSRDAADVHPPSAGVACSRCKSRFRYGLARSLWPVRQSSASRDADRRWARPRLCSARTRDRANGMGTRWHGLSRWILFCRQLHDTRHGGS